jgi:tetratricopeptide (TPR) repeat protein
VTKQERQFIGMTLLAWLLISASVYAWLGEGGRVFLHPDKNLSVQDSKKMAAMLAQPKRLEAMLLKTVVKDPQDGMAWQWLTRLYVQQEKWDQAAQTAEKAWEVAESADNLMIWCHALRKSDPKSWEKKKKNMAKLQKRYPEHHAMWEKIMQSDRPASAGF